MKVSSPFVCAVALAAITLAAAVGCRTAPPALGEALVIVDTDLPVPTIANRLRVDLYTEDRATWYVSRDVATLDPGAWPVSFSVFDPDEGEARDVVLRLRVHRGGVVRDYRGERFTPRPPSGSASDPAPSAPIPAGEAPRLLRDDGADITPASEPQPLVTVDRLLRIHLAPGVRGSVRVVLKGACAGTMADLVGGATCVDEEGVYATIPDAALDPDLTLPTHTLQGTFGAEAPCMAEVRPATTLPDGTPLFDDEACVPGAMFIFGSARAFGRGDASDVPERIAILPPFRMDRSEVTVARWRDAVARGFSPAAAPALNDGPINFSNAASQAACTWSTAPMGREALPLTCVSWASASAFCAFEGGALPTEAQWEYVAMNAGRDVKTPYPWGDEDATCARAVYARQATSASVLHGADCKKLGVGLPPVDTAAGPDGDVALGTGVVNLAGSVTEIVRDTFASLGSACWAAQGLDSPACVDPNVSSRALRGGSWATNAASLTGDVRGSIDEAVSSPFVGFRCIRVAP